MLDCLMPRKREYETDAERQQAYRNRLLEGYVAVDRLTLMEVEAHLRRYVDEPDLNFTTEEAESLRSLADHINKLLTPAKRAHRITGRRTLPHDLPSPDEAV